VTPPPPVTGGLHPLAAKEAHMPDTSPTAASTADAIRRVSTGNAGLDDILGGGLDAHRVYLLEGRPGTGKTTLALQYLLEGAAHGERGMYVTLSESKKELCAVAARHGWSLDALSIFELIPPEASLDPARELTLLHPAEMELSETTQLIFDQVGAVDPARIVFDSLSEMRLLAQNPLRYRRQILALKSFFAGRSCTVILLDDLSAHSDDLQLHSIAHGVITLEQSAVDYGKERRRLRILKMRGIAFRGGYHDFTIERGGLAIYPRLIAAEHHRAFVGETTTSGVRELDALLGGGIERGTSTLLIGGAGVGKSSIAQTYLIAAAARGEHGVLFAFDEGLGTIFARSAGLGMPLQEHVDSGRIRVQQIDPAEMAPGEFAHQVRQAVEKDGARIIVIDSLNGYLNAMPEERYLILQMHELLSYLNQLGVVTILILAQHGLMGPMQTPLDISYLSDGVLMLRYFEAEGRVRRAISVVKKRSAGHEDAIRELQLTEQGIKLGPPLTQFSGILSGVPTFRGEVTPLMKLATDNAAQA
jgi:circadian clock protein KaiC